MTDVYNFTSGECVRPKAREAVLSRSRSLFSLFFLNSLVPLHIKYTFLNATTTTAITTATAATTTTAITTATATTTSTTHTTPATTTSYDRMGGTQA